MTPIRDDKLRDTLRALVDAEDSPLTSEARAGRFASIDSLDDVAWFMAGMLVGAVYRETGEIIDQERAIAVARAEFVERETAEKIAAWLKLRATLFSEGMSPPDAIRYVATEIRAGEWRK